MLVPASLGIMETLLPVAGTSLIACQGLKVLLAISKYKFSCQRLLQPGGMPSSHTAVVTSLATTLGLIYGLTSPFFQISAVFGGIVIYDAITLRRAVSEHACRINMIYRQEGIRDCDELLENLGHTPLEVLVGLLIGLLTALIFFY